MKDTQGDWEKAGAPAPQMASQFAHAARDGAQEGGTERARWNSEAARAEAEGQGAQYIFNNGTISSHEKDMLVIDKQDRFTDPPPKEPDEACKVIQFPARNIETEQTTKVVEEDVWFAERAAGIIAEIWDIDDVPF